MYYYKFEDKYLFSLSAAYPYESVSEVEALNSTELYYLIELEDSGFRHSYAVCCADDLYDMREGVHTLVKSEIEYNADSRIMKCMDNRMVRAVNTAVANYEKNYHIENASGRKKRVVNVRAVGEVGGT